MDKRGKWLDNLHYAMDFARQVLKTLRRCDIAQRHRPTACNRVSRPAAQGRPALRPTVPDRNGDAESVSLKSVAKGFRPEVLQRQEGGGVGDAALVFP